MRTLQAKILDSTHLELTEPIPLRPGRRVEVSIDLDEEASASAPGSPSAKATRDPEESTHTGPRRERELAWRRANSQDLLERYAGQWVVLEGEEIVAHGRRMAPVVEQARSRGVRVPYVFYVEEARPGVVSIGL